DECGAGRRAEELPPRHSSSFLRAHCRPFLLPGCAASTSGAATTAGLEGRICPRIYDMSVQEKIGELRRQKRKLRVAVENVRNTFEAMEFNRNVRIAKLLGKTDAAVDRNRRVFIAVKNRNRRKSSGDVSNGVCLATIVIRAARGHHG